MPLKLEDHRLMLMDGAASDHGAGIKVHRAAAAGLCSGEGKTSACSNEVPKVRGPRDRVLEASQ